MSIMDIGELNVPRDLLEELFRQLKVGETDPSRGKTEDDLRSFLAKNNLLEKPEMRSGLPFDDERVKSEFGYPPAFSFLSPGEQLYALRRFPLFSDLDASHIEALTPTTRHSDSEFTAVIPKWDRIASSYAEATRMVVSLLKEVHGSKFHNYREGALTDQHLRLVDETSEAYRQLSDQPGDFYIFDAQVGKRWAGASIRHARARFLPEEFGLGPYETACLLLSHPERISVSGHLNIDCAGVEYRRDVQDSFALCLSFYWVSMEDHLGLYYDYIGDTYGQWGSVSGFRPQCEI